MAIKITIKPDSKTAKSFRKYMAEKEEFRKAVKKGNAVAYAKQSPEKFATPV